MRFFWNSSSISLASLQPNCWIVLEFCFDFIFWLHPLCSVNSFNMINHLSSADDLRNLKQSLWNIVARYIAWIPFGFRTLMWLRCLVIENFGYNNSFYTWLTHKEGAKEEKCINLHFFPYSNDFYLYKNYDNTFLFVFLMLNKQSEIWHLFILG